MRVHHSGQSRHHGKYFQICDNHEVYLTDLDHDEVPALFWWFPNQDDYKPPPPADESTSEKLERISKTIKVETKQKIEIETSLSRFEFFSNIFQTTRTEISEILHGSDLRPEDKIVRALEIKQQAEGITRLFQVGTENPRNH